ncbi:MAG: proline--tRNA ligase, partial [Clostridia bacterium]|nr:proline--tRNA ligase [Clostridia bacterium]
LHATAEEARQETEQMLNVYARFAKEALAMPVVKGQKTDKEKFAGAEATYTIEALMHDGKALQSGTSHYFGDGFSRAFEVQYTDKDNKLVHPHQTSWGTTTRLIGAVIMTHGDDNGLVLPPAIAPIQVVIVPIASHKEGVVEKATEICNTLKTVCRVKLDNSEQTPGWKFAEYEMKGVPLRLEIGPRDIENNQCVVVRRDNREKIFVNLDELTTRIPEILAEYHDALYNKALERRETMTYDAKNLDEMKEIADTKPGFIRAMWCGDRECEDKLKEIAGVTSRCIPFEQEHIGDTCVCCGKKADKMLYWGKAY